MKVSQEKVFKPVSIEIETEQEFATLMKMCVFVGDSKDAPSGVADLALHLENCIADAAGI